MFTNCRLTFLGLILVASLTWASASTPAHAQKIHALIVADQSPSAKWGVYAPNLTWDTLNISGFLEMNTPERLLNVTYLTMFRDADSKPTRVIADLRRQTPGPNDTVLFYFTGHGGIDDRGSYFALAGGKLYRDEVRDLLKAKQARLTVMLTDCCNTRSDGRRQIAMAPQFPRPATYTRLFQSLIVKPTGIVDINSSAPGESAFFAPMSGDEPTSGGSIFTSVLAKWADEHQDQMVTWEHLLREVSVKVHVAFREHYPKGAQMAKGAPVQTDQNVYARDYPGMPAAGSPRAGVQIRDNDGKGALIVEVVPDSPASSAYDILAEKYLPLPIGANVVSLNGKPVQDAEQFRALVKESPQILRVTLEESSQVTRQFLVRLRY